MRVRGYYFYFVKHKTAYEMLISDGSSDVCSSDLAAAGRGPRTALPQCPPRRRQFSCPACKNPATIGATSRRAQYNGAVQPRQTAAERPGAAMSERDAEIGRAACRERGCQDAENPVGRLSLKKKIS